VPATELLFRNPAFGRFFAARACSYIGDGVASVALILLVQSRQGTGVAVGALLLAQSLPRLLGPLAGTLADRLPARRLMVGCDLGQAAIYALIAWLSLALPVLLALVSAATFLQTLFQPAGAAALPRLVDEGDLLAANARFGSAFNLQVAVGPLLGGVLVATVGTDYAILVNATSFLGSALLLAGVPQLAQRIAVADRGVLAATHEGLVYVWRHPVVRTVCLALFFGVSIGAMDNVALVFLARESLGVGATGFGALSAAFGVGMIVGALLLTRGGRQPDTALLFLGGLALTGLGLMLTGLAPVLLLALAFQALAGIGNGVDNVAQSTLLQQIVPVHLLGRVYGVVSTAAFAGMGFASLAGGVLLDLTSPRVVFVLAGAGLIAVCAYAAPTLRSSRAHTASACR
jgi:MFS family permease